MRRQAKTKYAVLGILASGPKSGYDIRAEIQLSIGYFWQESYGQLYPILKQLGHEKLLSVRYLKQSGRPDKKVYRITKKGLVELRAWLPEKIERPPLREELLLKLFFGQYTQPETLIALVQEEAIAVRETLAELEQVKKRLIEHCKPKDIRHSLLTLNFGIEYMRMAESWATHSAKTITNWREN